MKKRSRKFLSVLERVDRSKVYGIDEGIALVKELAYAKFDESLDLAFRLGVDPRHADQMIRGALVLPSGTGKQVRVCVITSGEKLAEAEEAGADTVGSDDVVAKIAGGWLEFDRVIASPDMMSKLGRIGRILGPRGLMPNPKLGTVTPLIGKAVREHKAGKVEYRTEKNGIIHVSIGRCSFGVEALRLNFDEVASAIFKAKPSGAKGTYLKSLTASSTMGPGVPLNVGEVAQGAT